MGFRDERSADRYRIDALEDEVAEKDAELKQLRAELTAKRKPKKKALWVGLMVGVLCLSGVAVVVYVGMRRTPTGRRVPMETLRGHAAEAFIIRCDSIWSDDRAQFGDECAGQPVEVDATVDEVAHYNVYVRAPILIACETRDKVDLVEGQRVHASGKVSARVILGLKPCTLTPIAASVPSSPAPGKSTASSGSSAGGSAPQLDSGSSVSSSSARPALRTP